MPAAERQRRTAAAAASKASRCSGSLRCLRRACAVDVRQGQRPGEPQRARRRVGERLEPVFARGRSLQSQGIYTCDVHLPCCGAQAPAAAADWRGAERCTQSPVARRVVSRQRLLASQAPARLHTTAGCHRHAVPLQRRAACTAPSKSSIAACHPFCLTITCSTHKGLRSCVAMKHAYA